MYSKLNFNIKLLGLCSLLKIFVILFLTSISDIGLSPDEAQYWTWSQHLDWGYYSKPPGIAWAIFLGTSIFGNSLLGIRFSSILFGFFLPFLIYFLCRKGKISSKGSLWGALFCAFSPLGIIASTLAITDVGMIFFWTLALCFIASSFESDKKCNYYLVGLAIGLSALFKWSAYLLWPFLFLLIPLFPILRSWHIIGGFILSLFALLPSLYWNFQHDFVTFKHVFFSVNPTSSGNTLDFIGSQFALLSPLIAIFACASLWTISKHAKKMQPYILFCSLITLFSFSSLILLSLNKKVQGNWADFGYPTLFVLLAWYFSEHFKKEKWVYASIGTSISLVLFFFMIPFIQAASTLQFIQIPYALNVFRHNIGWNELSKVLESQDFDKENDFIFASKYQTSSILNYYIQSMPAYFFNIFSIRKNQFSFWPGLEQEINKNGFFLVTENEPYLSEHKSMIQGYIQKLNKYFDSIDYLGSYPIFKSYGKETKEVLIFKCNNYNGLHPPEVDLY